MPIHLSPPASRSNTNAPPSPNSEGDELSDVKAGDKVWVLIKHQGNSEHAKAKVLAIKQHGTAPPKAQVEVIESDIEDHPKRALVSKAHQ
jgi:hypothetical protein